MQAQGGPSRAELWGWGVNIALQTKMKLPAKTSSWPSKEGQHLSECCIQ